MVQLKSGDGYPKIDSHPGYVNTGFVDAEVLKGYIEKHSGGGWFTPVINYPEVAILGVGTIAQQPIVNDEGELAVGRVMKLSLSFDHRIVDGATAQKAMNNIKRLLADPELLLMEG